MEFLSKIKALLEPPSARVLAVKELEDAQRHHLAACSAEEHSKKMREFYELKIARLSAYLKD